MILLLLGCLSRQTLSISYSPTSNILESLDCWLLQLLDLLLDHRLKGLVVDEARKFSPTISLLVLLHFLFKPVVDCKQMCFRALQLDGIGPNSKGRYLHFSPEHSRMLSHFQNSFLRVVKMLSLSPHLSSSPAARLMAS